jgi:hypothetical protein
VARLGQARRHPGFAAWVVGSAAAGWGSWWRDRDQRRAALLSAVLHLALVLVAVWVLRPTPREVPLTYLVIDIGLPAVAEERVDAPTSEAPAAATARPQVADVEVGNPRTAAAPVAAPTTPDPTPRTVQPQLPAAAAAAPEPVETLAMPPRPAPALPAPAPEVAAAAPATTPLPQIDVPVLEPTQLAPRVPVPMPAVAAVVPEVRSIAPTPQVSVTAAQSVPRPEVQAAVAAAEAVPTPAIRASVPATQAVPMPEVRATVEEAAPVPTPDVASSVAAARPVALPDVQTHTTPGRDVAVAPQVSVAAPRRVPTPQLRADVIGPAVTEGPAVDAAAPVAATTTAATREVDAPAGGDAVRAGQTGAPSEAATGRGAAAGPEGSPTPTGTPAPPRTPFRQDLERPVAVIVDNVGGYPQFGLRAASHVYELPVEGGLSRLMLVFDRTDPDRVGPVRSARDYFVELARSLDAVLVHDGGSPGAMATITATATPTLNAYNRGELFSRGDGRAPYNLFAAGDGLRTAANRLDVGRGRTVSGTIYRPADELLDASDVRVRYGAGYETGFRYESGLNAYRWLRNGDAASDARGEAVLVDAVLVAAIDAVPVPGDGAGRLYIALRGGEATLFVFGKAVRGRWEIRAGQGLRFVTGDGEVDLAPFKTWVVFTPSFERTVVRGPSAP